MAFSRHELISDSEENWNEGDDAAEAEIKAAAEAAVAIDQNWRR